MDAQTCTDCTQPATHELVRTPGPNRPMCERCSRPAAIAGMWVRPMRASLACQCDIPGIVQCDMHGPTE